MTSPIERSDLAQLLPPEFRGNLGFLLNSARRALVAEIDAVMDGDLSIRHFAILSVLHHRGGLRQTDIAGVIGIDRTTTMKIVDELERAGMLRRTTHPDDRRANAPELTSQGRSRREKMPPRHQAPQTNFTK